MTVEEIKKIAKPIEWVERNFNGYEFMILKNSPLKRPSIRKPLYGLTTNQWYVLENDKYFDTQEEAVEELERLHWECLASMFL
nr:MAG TPA: hypothetical protein [Caudoviricetes sp.]